ncbi:hypothetical protein N9W21_07210, partial [Shewanella sp.]|nr:hypothetical protein [Shewanella sp.]
MTILIDAESIAKTDEKNRIVLEEKRAKDTRKRLPFHFLQGLILTSVFFVVSLFFFKDKLDLVGGCMVGLSLVGQFIVHWIELNPTKENLKHSASRWTVISGVIAFTGTI